MENRNAPLKGIRVLDFSRAMAGPFCTQMLGDMGAEIIKVERPDGGDETRRWGPFWNEQSCYFLAANRNKKSIAIDLKSEAGRQIAATLAGGSDVVVENFRPGKIARLGLGYEALSKNNPRLIFCSISGFGQDGPRALEPAYDLLMQGFAGLMGLTGYPDSEPVRAGLPVTDFCAGQYAAYAIMVALFRREIDGVGQKIDTSLLEGQLSWLSYYMVGFFADGVVQRGMGSAHHSLTPYKAYKAKDDYLILAVGNDAQWGRLCRALERPELAQDPRFITNVERLANRNKQDEILEDIFSRYMAADLIERIMAAGIPCGPINKVDQIVADPQVEHLGIINDVPHSFIPDLKLPGIPVHFSRTPGEIQGPPPLLGEHTDRILSDAGYTGKEISEFHANGIIA
ncbi:MAG: CoA transferase [Anaerolineales bacterium]|nr:CoA transferase [Anaerolineales bacterium]